MYNACIVPAVAHGSQKWAMRKEKKDKIQVMQNKMKNAMLDIKQKTKINFVKVRKSIPGNRNIVEECLLKKWDLAGHLGKHGGDK